MPALQLALAGFVFPAEPRARTHRHRHWRLPWLQLPLTLEGKPIVEWSPPERPLVRLAQVLPFPEREKPAAPAVHRDLFAEWETKLAGEGMPAELHVDQERAKDPAVLDFLAAPGGGCRPLKRSRGLDGDGNRTDPGASLGAWWLGELPDDGDGSNRLERLEDGVRAIVERAISEGAEEQEGAALTAKQAFVLRHWMGGMRQTEIARIEHHSKVSVFWKLRRALRSLETLLRDSALTFTR